MAIHEINKPEGHYLKGDKLQIDDELSYVVTTNPEINSQGGGFLWKTVTNNIRSWVLRDMITAEDILVVDSNNKTVSVIAPYTLLGATAVTPNVITKVFGDSPVSAAINDVVLADTTAGNIIINLPAATSNAVIRIKKLVAANTITIDGNGTETIDGNLTHSLTVQSGTVTLFCDGSNWFIF